MKNLKSHVIALLFLIISSGLSGRELSLPLTNGIAPGSKNSDVIVYLHSDRSYYLPGESVFFKAYLLSGSDNKSNPVNDTLQVTILDQEGLEVASEKFPLDNSQIYVASARNIGKMTEKNTFPR
jgi:uncharacterized protein YfaS (alpha-2-macroglobulin family)